MLPNLLSYLLHSNFPLIILALCTFSDISCSCFHPCIAALFMHFVKKKNEHVFLLSLMMKNIRVGCSPFLYGLLASLRIVSVTYLQFSLSAKNQLHWRQIRKIFQTEKKYSYEVKGHPLQSSPRKHLGGRERGFSLYTQFC